MSPPINNVAEAEAPRQADVASIARRLAPPDSHQLTLALQTTLELERLLALFSRHLADHVPHDGVELTLADGNVVAAGRREVHACSYNLRLGDHALGELRITRHSRFGEYELATCEFLLCSLMYPLRNAIQYREAVQAASRDPLTGLGNRAALESALRHEIELTRRSGRALSLLAVDLDLFKRVNDHYGHSAGDAVLWAAAERIAAAVRSADQAFRFGGEEFVVLLNDTDRTGARRVAERVRRYIAEREVNYGGARIHVTASIGGAVYRDGDDFHALFDRADLALYRAKADGRDRVVMEQGALSTPPDRASPTTAEKPSRSRARQGG